MNIFSTNKKSNQGFTQVGLNTTKDMPQLRSADTIEKILQKKCQIHPKRDAEFLHLVPNAPNPRLCISCIQEGDIPHKAYLQIRDVLEATSDSDLFSYPILSDPQLRKIIKSHVGVLDSITDKINNYFSDLSRQIEISIEKAKQAQKLKIIKLADSYKNSQDCWKEIANINELQGILFEQGNEVKLGEFITKHCINTEVNTKKIQQFTGQFESMRQEFSDQQPNQIKIQINSLLEELDFFIGPNGAPLKAINQSVEQKIQRVLLGQPQEPNGNVLGYTKNNLTNISDLNQQINKKFVTQAKEDLLQSTELILSTIDESQKLKISKNSNHELEFYNNDKTDYFCGQAFLNFILDPLANYVIQMKLEQMEGQDKYFRFGLLIDSKKNTTFGDDEDLCHSELEDSGLATLVKGKLIQNEDTFLEKRLEMRINLQRRILKVALLPDYESVVTVDEPEMIDPTISYRFFVNGLNPQTKMTITKLEKVGEFNDLM